MSKNTDYSGQLVYFTYDVDLLQESAKRLSPTYGVNLHIEDVIAMCESLNNEVEG